MVRVDTSPDCGCVEYPLELEPVDPALASWKLPVTKVMTTGLVTTMDPDCQYPVTLRRMPAVKGVDGRVPGSKMRPNAVGPPAYSAYLVPKISKEPAHKG